jgi:hypothetical protein
MLVTAVKMQIYFQKWLAGFEKWLPATCLVCRGGRLQRHFISITESALSLIIHFSEDENFHEGQNPPSSH